MCSLLVRSLCVALYFGVYVLNSMTVYYVIKMQIQIQIMMLLLCTICCSLLSCRKHGKIALSGLAISFHSLMMP